MSNLWLNFIISLFAVTLMLVMHAFLIMCETSLVRFRYGGVSPGTLERLKRRRGIERLIDNSARTGRVVRFSKTLCTVAVGLLLMLIMEDCFRFFEASQTSSRWWIAGLSFGCATSVHFLFAEILPRGMAMRDPVKGLLVSWRILLFFQVLTWPLMLLVGSFKKMFFRQIGVDVRDELNPLDVDVQIRAMGEDTHRLSPVARKIMNHTLQMQDLVVQDVLLPRHQVIICDLEQDPETNLRVMKKAGHTRFPLCRGNLDNCEGILHIKDLFRLDNSREGINLVKLKRTVAVFELETSLEDALERMLRARFHMGLVVGEFGETVGVVTLESILEELVGEIQDEFDLEEAQITALRAPNTFRILGSAPVHEVEAVLGVQIGKDEISTFSGLITGELGRIPESGETLELNGMQITIDDVNERRVISARVLYEAAP